jgi:predicted HD phosphohydrolase
MTARGGNADGAEPGLSPLAKTDWRYVERDSLDDFDADDWQRLDAQRQGFHAANLVTHVLRLLEVSRDDPTFGYRINNYRHCLQSATLAMRDGCDEESVAVAVLHDVGFTAAPRAHGLFAATLMGPYVSERNCWMLCHHEVFVQFHVRGRSDVDRHERERWRGHPYFEWTATFVDKYDQNAIRPDFDAAPLSVFEPMVRRVFAREPRADFRIGVEV